MRQFVRRIVRRAAFRIDHSKPFGSDLAILVDQSVSA